MRYGRSARQESPLKEPERHRRKKHGLMEELAFGLSQATTAWSVELGASPLSMRLSKSTVSASVA